MQKRIKRKSRNLIHKYRRSTFKHRAYYSIKNFHLTVVGQYDRPLPEGQKNLILKLQEGSATKLEDASRLSCDSRRRRNTKGVEPIDM